MVAGMTLGSAVEVGAPARPATAPATRVAAIDIVRGAVMVLMAIDHVRVYSGQPAGGPSPGIFFTRWVTHFCAPAFVFLAGTSTFLYSQRHRDTSRFLLLRGAWLVLLELTVIRICWTFNFDFQHYMLAGVIWVIGWCMILLALLRRLPALVVGAVGLAILAGHDIVDPFLPRLMPALAQIFARQTRSKFERLSGVESNVADMRRVLAGAGNRLENTGKSTILFIDDDADVRNVGTAMLKRLGFHVLSATNGREGLNIFREQADAIACVILDLTMPEMGGEETFCELIRRRSDVRVILSSGFDEQEVTRRFVGTRLAGFIQKPYTLAKLRKALTRVLS